MPNSASVFLANIDTFENNKMCTNFTCLKARSNNLKMVIIRDRDSSLKHNLCIMYNGSIVLYVSVYPNYIDTWGENNFFNPIYTMCIQYNVTTDSIFALYLNSLHPLFLKTCNLFLGCNCKYFGQYSLWYVMLWVLLTNVNDRVINGLFLAWLIGGGGFEPYQRRYGRLT